MQYLFYFLLISATYLEVTVTTAPLVLAVAIAYAVSTQKENVFFSIFLSGAVLDLVSGKTVGFTSLYLLCSIFALLLYQRKYEIATYPFIAIATAILSFVYLLLFVHTALLAQIIVSVILAEMLFMLFKFVSLSLRMK